LFPPRDGRFSFLRNEREAFLEQNREAYDSLVTSLKSMETEFAALTSKPEELTRIARRSFELRQSLSFLFRIERAEFRLLVRAEEQRRIPDGNADRRQPNSAGAAVRKNSTR